MTVPVNFDKSASFASIDSGSTKDINTQLFESQWQALDDDIVVAQPTLDASIEKWMGATPQEFSQRLDTRLPEGYEKLSLNEQMKVQTDLLQRVSNATFAFKMVANFAKGVRKGTETLLNQK